MSLTIRQAQELKLLEPGDAVVAIQGWRGGLGNSNTLRVYSRFMSLMVDFASSPLVDAYSTFFKRSLFIK